jgi:hypothetical protein
MTTMDRRDWVILISSFCCSHHLRRGGLARKWIQRSLADELSGNESSRKSHRVGKRER